MKWFGQKGADAKHRGVKKDAAIGDAPSDKLAHRVTQDLARSENLAVMVAESRASNVLEVSDLLAGLYIYDWERLGRYWADPEPVEAFLQHICRISPQRWHHWIENYDRKRHEQEPHGIRYIFRKTKRNGAGEAKPLARSTELQGVLKRAEDIAPSHDQVDGRTIPVLTCECVLLCIAKTPESEIAHRMVASGLDVKGLEREARFPRHARRK
jgi:hypothetical protein